MSPSPSKSPRATLTPPGYNAALLHAGIFSCLDGRVALLG
jgi:hypothetical protein